MVSSPIVVLDIIMGVLTGVSYSSTSHIKGSCHNSSFVHHFVAIGESKRELQSGNAQSGSNLTIFSAV